MGAEQPDMAYDTGGIRDGAGTSRTTADMADSAITRLLGSTIAAGAFGDVAGAERLAAGLGTTRDGYAKLSYDVHAHHLELDKQAFNIAAQGDELGVKTADIARQGGPRTVLDGMQG